MIGPEAPPGRLQSVCSGANPDTESGGHRVPSQEDRLSPAQLKQRQTAALKHGIYRARTGIPEAERKRLARYQREIYELLPWVGESDAYTVSSFARVLLLQDMMVAALAKSGVLQENGEPTRLVGELRHTLQLGLAFSTALAMTPASRAKLGLTAAEGRRNDLATELAALRLQREESGR